MLLKYYKNIRIFLRNYHSAVNKTQYISIRLDIFISYVTMLLCLLQDKLNNLRIVEPAFTLHSSVKVATKRTQPLLTFCFNDRDECNGIR